ncbi:hypothetical protein LguiA_023149 [Lonicera macranthoides]
MDSYTRLDYALFQLTPTRTRCDLVIFSGNAKEKLASGLLEPFLSHLNSAKDQISKGGYSITLRPATDAAWFTKSTLERFVRFVSTPEVLERFVTIETEIAQIESSVQSAGQLNGPTEIERNVLAADGNAKHSAVSLKLKGESGGPTDAVHEDNSKVHLQRVLETRKAVLRKEQAMAYARALVAGFEMDYIDDLISFADAFGASRLRNLKPPPLNHRITTSTPQPLSTATAPPSITTHSCAAVTPPLHHHRREHEDINPRERNPTEGAGDSGMVRVRLEMMISARRMNLMLVRWIQWWGFEILVIPREACINFMELCNKKNNDGLWMDEIAAMQGFLLAGEDNDHSREFMINVQNGGLSGGKQNSSIDAASDSTLSHGSLETNQGSAEYSMSSSFMCQSNSFSSSQPLYQWQVHLQDKKKREEITVVDQSVNAAEPKSSSCFQCSQPHDNNLPTSTQTQSTDGKAQIPMPWASHLPQYMQNFQGPMFQQMPPYQGYHYPGMQAPPYYPGNMPWHSNLEDSRLGPDAEHKSYSRKERRAHGKGRHASKQDVHTDPSDSSSASDSDEYEEHGKRNILIDKQHSKRNGKRSSRKVVIRNINYISSKADGETEGNPSDEDGFIDGDSLKQQVEEAVGSLERRHRSSSNSNKKRGGSKHGNAVGGSNGGPDQDFEDVLANNNGREKRTESWDIFQNLLLRDADSASNGVDSQSQQGGEGNPSVFDVESEQMKEHRKVSADSFIMAERVIGTEDKTHNENFEAGESARPVIKRESRYEELLFPLRNESENSSHGAVTNYATESPLIKSQTEGDWFIGNQPKSADQDNYTIMPLIEDHFQSGKSTKDVPIDDSFMIQSRPLDNSSDNQPRTDMFMVSDIVGATQLQQSTSDHLQEKVEASSVYEPEDLYMVLGREAAAEQAVATWNPEMDYEDSNQLAEAAKRHSDAEPADCDEAKANGAPEGKVLSKATRPKGSVGSRQKSKPDVITRSKKPSISKTMTPKSQSEKEEEKRKRMEELLIQRQRRIAERSAASSVTPAISRSRSLKENKTTNGSMKNEKPKGQALTQDTKKLNKPIPRSSTLNRLSAAQVTQNLSQTELKTSKPRKSPSKENGIVDPSLSKRTSGSESKKLNVNKVKVSDKKTVPKNSKVLPSKKDGTSASASLPIEIRTCQANETTDVIDPSENVKELHSVSPVIKNVDMVLKSDMFDDNCCNAVPYNGDLSVDTENHSTRVNHLEGDNNVLPKESPVLHEDTEVSKDLNSATLEIKEDEVANKKFPVSPEITVVEFSTPPPNELELNQSRKKWNSSDTSPKATKGLRKLLFFGRKSRNSP